MLQPLDKETESTVAELRSEVEQLMGALDVKGRRTYSMKTDDKNALSRKGQGAPLPLITRHSHATHTPITRFLGRKLAR